MDNPFVQYKRAHEFEFVGQCDRMCQQPVEMQKAIEAGDLHAAREHAHDILNIGARGWIGFPQFEAAAWASVRIAQLIMSKQWVKCSCGWPIDGEFCHGGDVKCGFCIECGAQLTFEWADEFMTQIRLRRMCFTCNFWQEKVEWTDGIRIEGTHYHASSEDVPQRTIFRGFGGSPHYIEMFDGRLIESRNLWCQGAVPHNWKERLPDNARFLKKDEFEARSKAHEQQSTNSHSGTP